mgnify:CR=1 FL=1
MGRRAQALPVISRWIIAWLLWWAACTQQLKGQVTTVTWYLPMLQELGGIADTATVEHVRCLLGARRADTLYVVVAWAPRMAFSSPVVAKPTEECPPLLTVGEWHNHLPHEYAITGEQLPTHRTAAEFCELSPIDRRRERVPNPVLFQVISVTKDISCAWVLNHEGRYERVSDWPPRAP